ncbi:MAG: TIGR02300 family protein [Rhodospirillales bacterium]|nr:TIGR02300 family protein [Rhodospirillales bacterium]MBT5522325.1 TIGR02300 family protein [Rhodospirillales bacterium]MBT6108828.1 TIGR02300 family protein [Rhodospirillales bacterium]MBT6824838.1 TIGR02300 family protein [Rhodospirillales bacterium]MBT7147470.1 TIGR02300 family protein [Rhodospirillales bacterium]
MAKPEWGTKRLCPSCGIRFYDMKNNPINCPGCEELVPIETVVRSRRSAPAAKPAAKPAPVVAEEKTETDAEDDVIAIVDVAVDADVDEDNDDDESLIEDTSDLAENEEVSEIAEHMETDVTAES